MNAIEYVSVCFCVALEKKQEYEVDIAASGQ